MVTCSEVFPAAAGGTVTVHTFSDGQLVAVTSPSKEATMRPSELMKFEPVTVIAWPELPEAGARNEICGGAPGVDGAKVVVVLSAPLVARDAPDRPCCVLEAAVGEGPPEPRLIDTARAIPDATTRTATTRTAATSQRSEPLSDPRSSNLGRRVWFVGGPAGGWPGPPMGDLGTPWLARER